MYYLTPTLLIPNSLTPLPYIGEAEKLTLIQAYKRKIETELEDICSDILEIIKNELIPNRCLPLSLNPYPFKPYPLNPYPLLPP
jgi:hypothetical protein